MKCCFLKNDRKLIAIFLLAFLLRFAIAFFGAEISEDGDSGGYISMSEAIQEGDFFFQGASAGIAESRTPGYPLFLSLFHENLWLVKYAQALLDSASALIVFFITLNLTKKEGAAYSAALLYAISPFFISFSFMLLTEAVFTFFFLLGFLLALRAENPRDYAIAGLVIGFSLLVRPVALPIPLLIAGFLFFRTKKLAPVLLFLFFSYLLCGGWVLRNLAVDNELYFSKISEVTFVCWQGPLLIKEISLEPEMAEKAHQYHLDDIDKCASQSQENISEGKEVLSTIMYAHLPEYVFLNMKAFLFLLSPPTPNYIMNSLGMETPHIGDLIAKEGLSMNTIVSQISSNTVYLFLFLFFIAYQILFYIFIILGARNRENWLFCVLLLAVLLYLAFVSGLVAMVSGYRYRLPFEAFAFPLAGEGAYVLFLQAKNTFAYMKKPKK
jgi:4-amino-4-deoxy-L-arabinose transferase-like glycosyltransferase